MGFFWKVTKMQLHVMSICCSTPDIDFYYWYQQLAGSMLVVRIVTKVLETLLAVLDPWKLDSWRESLIRIPGIGFVIPGAREPTVISLEPPHFLRWQEPAIHC